MMNHLSFYRLLMLAGLTMLLAQACPAANPNGYYNAINGKKAESLKTTLSQLLLNHTVHEYNSLWTFFQSTDRHPDGTIWDMYSSTVRTSTWGMNREHSFPKSWWGGTVNAAYTDINHLYPADADANMAKGNYPLGMVGTAVFDNGMTKVGYNVFPGYSTSADVFEPADEYKGDFARTYFYMVTCYQDYTWKYTYMVDQNTYPTLKPWAVRLLLQWSRQDPVSAKELNRNEEVFKIQNNRNPFIDYPQLAEYIWGDSVNYVFRLDTLHSTPELATPTNDTRLDFGAVIAGSAKTRTLYVKGTALNASLSAFIERDGNYQYFKSSVETIAKDKANAGYQLTVYYQPSSAGTHQSSLLLYDGGIDGSVKVNMTGKSIPLDSLTSPMVEPATNITSGGFTANWAAAAYSDSYCLQLYALQNGQPNLVRTIDSIPENTFDVDELNDGWNYCYDVKARLGTYLSAASTEMPVTLLSGIVSAADESDLRIYTAPGTLYFQAPKAGERIELFDLSGSKIYQTTSTGHIQSIGWLRNGLYFLRHNGSTQKILLF
ncbi:MAG: endonuclease [Bacteroidota bacterium]|nr:endonuclease [Bacteroidota bacterium]